MSDSFSSLYENSNGWRFSELVRDLRSAGLQLLRPRQGAVLLFDDGDQIESSEEELSRILDGGSDCSFQWWLEENHNICCTGRVIDDVRVMSFWMDGTDSMERARIGRALRTRFLAGEGRSVGWVFDPDGVTADYDWNKFFASQSDFDWSWVERSTP